jgi:hypothetical protein
MPIFGNDLLKWPTQIQQSSLTTNPNRFVRSGGMDLEKPLRDLGENTATRSLFLVFYTHSRTFVSATGLIQKFAGMT